MEIEGRVRGERVAGGRGGEVFKVEVNLAG